MEDGEDAERRPLLNSASTEKFPCISKKGSIQSSTEDSTGRQEGDFKG